MMACGAPEGGGTDLQGQQSQHYSVPHITRVVGC